MTVKGPSTEACEETATHSPAMRTLFHAGGEAG
jgi:hypothetical protein